jgi:hypothetical protein
MGENENVGSGAGGAPKTSGLAIASLVLGIIGVPLAGFLLFGLIGLILGIAALVGISKSGGRIGGQGLAIAGTCLSGASLLLFVLSLAMLLPALAAARERARRTKCTSNLKQIGYGVHLYSTDWYDRFPDSVEKLIEANIIMDREVLRCPSSSTPPGGSECGYGYVTGVHPVFPVDCVVAHDKSGNHLDGRNVLFVGGNVEWMTEAAFQEALARTQKELDRRRSRR